MVIGVLGSGPSQRKATYALLNDAISPEAKFVLPGTAPEFTDAVRHVADWAHDNGHEIVFLADQHSLTDLSDYGDDPVVTEVASVREVLGEFVDNLYVAWNDEDDPEQFVEGALKRGVKVFDLSDGLYPITLGDETEVEIPQQSKPEPVLTVVGEEKSGKQYLADEAQNLTATVMEPLPTEPRGIGGEPALTGEALDLVIEALFNSSFADDVADIVIKKIRERLA